MTRPGLLYGKPWSEEEYIIVLDAYFCSKGQPRHENSPFVQDAAKLLGRTPASIYMRMENFASIDPDESEHRRGLVKIGPLCAKVFEEWRRRRDHLQSTAEVLRRLAERSAHSQLELFGSNPVALPKAFGKYELLDLIGEGGFGSVYSCIHTVSGEVGALKIIRLDKVGEPDSVHRFFREIRAMKSLDHPHLICVHDDNLDKEKEFPGFVMDLAETNLTSHLQANWTTERTEPLLGREEALDILYSVLSAVAALHSHVPRIIHRDVNPNNILRLADGRWVVADFGLAKFLDTVAFTTTFETRTRQAGLGVVHWAAPEQWRDFKKTDERTDIYSLGVLLWQLFSTEDPPHDRQHSGLPDPLQEVFLKATHREPARRFASVTEMSSAIDTALAEIQ